MFSPQGTPNNRSRFYARPGVERLKDRSLLSAGLFDPFPAVADLFAPDPALANEAPPSHGSGDLNQAVTSLRDNAASSFTPSASQPTIIPTSQPTSISPAGEAAGVDPQLTSALSAQLAASSTIAEQSALGKSQSSLDPLRGPNIQARIVLYVSNRSTTSPVLRYNFSAGSWDSAFKLQTTIPQNPEGVVWFNNLLFVADGQTGGGIYTYDKTGAFQAYFANTQGWNRWAEGITYNNNQVYIAVRDGSQGGSDNSRNDILRYNADGTAAPSANYPGTAYWYRSGNVLNPGDNLYMPEPEGITFDSSGSLYVAGNPNYTNGHLTKLTENGTTHVVTGSRVVDSSTNHGPDWVTLDGSGNVYYSKSNDNSIYKYVPSTGTASRWDDGNNPKLDDPKGLYWDTSANKMYTADFFSPNSVSQYNSDGTTASQTWNNGAGDPLKNPVGLGIGIVVGG
jgi:hypothetical protein